VADEGDIVAAMRRVLARSGPVSAIAFRSVATRFASREDLITGAGARGHGGRWNPPGAFHTVYLSLDVDTAVGEFFGNYAHFGLEAAGRTPYLTAAVEARLAVVAI
jgi:RES domain-containing protein